VGATLASYSIYFVLNLHCGNENPLSPDIHITTKLVDPQCMTKTNPARMSIIKFLNCKTEDYMISSEGNLPASCSHLQ
jgi:hypothetical protein